MAPVLRALYRYVARAVARSAHPAARSSTLHIRRHRARLRQIGSCHPLQRLSSLLNRVHQVLRHEWFASTDWEAVLRREVSTPWVPPPRDYKTHKFDIVDVLDPSRGKLPPPYQPEMWEELFEDFGPYRHAPWPERPGDNPTPPAFRPPVP